MKHILIIVCLMALIGVAIGINVKADDAVVTATVTIGTVSVTVDPTGFDYGSMPYNTSKESHDILSDPKNIKATVGSVVTDLDIKGAHTGTEGTFWTLVAAVGDENEYVHAFGLATDGATRPGSYTNLTTGNATFKEGVAIDADEFFGLKITTPTSGVATQQNAVVTLTASFGG